MPNGLPVNGAIIGNWQNWARVLLMVLIAAFAVDQAQQLFNKWKDK